MVERWLLILCFALVSAIFVSVQTKQVDPHLSVTVANYQHRFERSMNFKKFRWTLSNVDSQGICDACNVLVPEVSYAVALWFRVTPSPSRCAS